jgi:hypothetical protein
MGLKSLKTDKKDRKEYCFTARSMQDRFLLGEFVLRRLVE